MPSYLDARGTPETPQALRDHHCLIDSNAREGRLWRFGSAAEGVTVPVSGPFEANSPSANAAMARQGLGIARCPLHQVARDFANGTLVRLLQSFEDGSAGLYALYPYNRFLTARVRALIDHLAERFGP